MTQNHPDPDSYGPPLDPPDPAQAPADALADAAAPARAAIHRADVTAKLDKFDVNKLTLGEVDTIETLAGLSVDMLGEKSSPKGKLMAALGYVIKKRTNPSYTFPMATTLTLDEIVELIGEDDEPEDRDAAPSA